MQSTDAVVARGTVVNPAYKRRCGIELRREAVLGETRYSWYPDDEAMGTKPVLFLGNYVSRRFAILQAERHYNEEGDENWQFELTWNVGDGPDPGPYQKGVDTP